MIVTVFTNEAIYELKLPQKAHGRHWVYDHGIPASRLISIEGDNQTWRLKSSQRAIIVDDLAKRKDAAELRPMSQHTLHLIRPQNRTHKTARVLADPITLNRQQFAKYTFRRHRTLRVGRSADNDIVIASPFITDYHMTLTYTQTGWALTDDGSSNGTFVNNRRARQQNLKPGDIVTLVRGCAFIIGSNFIAVNNPDNNVTVRSSDDINSPQLLRHPPADLDKRPFPYTAPAVDDSDTPFDIKAYLHSFSRSPRFRTAAVKPGIIIEDPPQNQIGEEAPFMLTFGPALTMGMGSGCMLFFAVSNAMSSGNWSHAIPSIAMASCMLLGVVLWPILTKRHDKNRRKNKEALRQTKYAAYLESIRTQIKQECANQAKTLHSVYITVDHCISRIQNISRTLWERGPRQPDFLVLRLGLGHLPLDTEIKYPTHRFTLEEDNLRQELLNLQQEAKTLDNVPITLSLIPDYITGIIGDRPQAVSMAKGLIIQIAALFSYEEVKLVLLYDPQEEDTFGFTRWLPHIWDNSHTIRFLATTPGEVKEISAYLEQEIKHRAQQNDKTLAKTMPYYILFSLSHALAQEANVLTQYYDHEKNLNISVITLYNQLGNLPKDSTLVIELADPAAGTRGELASALTEDPGDDDAPALTHINNLPATGKIYNLDDPTGAITHFAPDIHVSVNPLTLSHKLANILLDTHARAYQLPDTVTFLELFGVGKIEHLNVLSRWQENNPTKSLACAIGLNTLGKPLALDLHEKYHGSHGLIAGTTGSGKSELIIAIILSLAINYHPHEMAFVFIDYKGGGTAKAFAHLPHTVGIITNLDGPAIHRSLISIKSELKRRQTLFAKASDRLGVSNIDIYKYQELYRQGTVTEPLQHLVLCADEFAELKTQQPEFMNELISAARIGRSLGVHLILATQKPSGVVNDQIWSNTRFRICLKVQDKADSQDMLKRPEAAELTQRGRFYFQVGPNEIFQQGQSAWAGAAYYPSDKAATEKDDAVVAIDRNGRPLCAAKPGKPSPRQTDPPKQLDAITDYLSIIAAEEQIQNRPLWLPPLAPDILLEDIRLKYRVTRPGEPFMLRPLIGEYDDPANQYQGPLYLPLTEAGSAIIYGSEGSGKTTFLNTLLTALMKDHSPIDLHIYLLDFAAETQRAFIQAPHVGDVALSYENEKITNLFKQLQDQLIKRKKLFADYGGSYITYMRAVQEHRRFNPDPWNLYHGNTELPLPALPNLLTVIHNYSAFSEAYEDLSRQQLIKLAREGVKYGIFFILTASSALDIRYHLRQNFKQLFALQLNDTSEYHGIVGNPDGRFPAGHKGRGLAKLDGAVYEYQIASVTRDPNPFTFIQTQSQALSQTYPNLTAPRIPILPAEISIDFLRDHITEPPADLTAMTLPIGLACDTLQVSSYPLGQSPLHFVLSPQGEHRPFLSRLARLIAGHSGAEVMVIDPGGSPASPDTGPLAHITDPQDIVATLKELSRRVTQDSTAAPPAKPLILMITAYMALRQTLSDDQVSDLISLMENISPAHHIILLCGEQAENLGRIKLTAWYQARYPTPADTYIWIGPGLKEQYTFALKERLNGEQSRLPPGYAYSVIRGQAVKIKILGAKTEEETPWTST